MLIKTGEPIEINRFYVNDKEVVCDKCGKIINTVKVGETNEIVCDCEENDEQGDD